MLAVGPLQSAVQVNYVQYCFRILLPVVVVYFRLSNIWEEIPGKRHIYCNSLQSGQSDYMTAGFIATFVPVVAPTESPTPTEGLSTGQIAGIAIGSVFGVLLLLLLLIVLILLW